MPVDTQPLLEALDAVADDVVEIKAHVARLEAGLELVRRHVVALGQRTTRLEGERLTPAPIDERW